jgi:hypothetical protein
MKAKSFKQWLKANHAKAKDPRLSDLWGDAKADNNYPWKSSYLKQLEYLTYRTRERAVYDTLRSAWHSYIDYLLGAVTDEED